ncbi:MAG: RHS repeat-associated core domain-containing protein, partial [Rubrivivax sp.]|nr:RHS repeat-associated core domain-containing protein [Rubrivivax sp.]
GIRWRENEGKLLKLEEGAPSLTGVALRTTTYSYRNAVGQRYPDRWGDSELFTGDYLSWLNRPQDQRMTVQQGTSFTWQADPGAEGFDEFANPARVAQFSGLGFRRDTQTLYENNRSKWVLGQVKQIVDLGSGRVPQAHDYDSATAQRIRSYSFGLLKVKYGYHADGTLHTSADAVNPPTVLSNYWRGVPRNVSYADGSSVSAGVNNLGLLTHFTNAAGTTTSYSYDAAGRLAAIHPPVGFFPTIVNYEQVPYPDRGLGAGHWRQSTNTGDARNVRYFDALWRERLLYEYDDSNEAATSRAVESRYDADGRKSFMSYPQRSLGSVDAYRPGHGWTYDALDRVLAYSQDSELGTLTTTTEHLPGFAKRVTNPRGYVNTFGYQAFDAPIEDSIARIDAPQGVVVLIPRDVFGKPSAITRAGGGASATRTFVYDVHQRLCKTVEPETGATIQFHDAAGNVAWRASGQPYTGTASGACDQAIVGGGSKISFGYDSRNRLTSTAFGDGRPAITRSYTADGLLQQLVSSSFTWTYSYNNLRLLVQEAFSVPGQAPGAGWNFNWGINGYGNVSSITDPWGTMHYAPNALGEPTQVSGYASGVTYHPNGMVAGYTLANGITRSVALNLRGLPAQWQDAAVVNDHIAYDANGNVTGIQDVLQAVNTRSMAYDGLDRLTAANGPWGSGLLGYDALDNLIYSQMGGRTLTHHIDAATNRLGSLSGSQSVAMGYDANGNLAARGGQTYSFDIANRMRVAWGKANYDYDGNGRRSWVVFADGSTQLNAYSGTGTAGQLRFSAHSIKGNTRYVYLGDKLIAEVSSQTGTSFVHTDVLGSPVARTNFSGAVSERTRYEPYGATVAGSTNPTGIGFTGHVNDADTGLVYMQQRYYDPIAGRFLSVDPVVTDASSGSHFNRYVYAENNPHKYVDPDGRDSYLVSRPLGDNSDNKRLVHNFVVSHAKFVGDPNARVFSFGKTNDGTTGRVDGKTQGMSAGTEKRDGDFWKSLSGASAKAAEMTSPIKAGDDTVAATAGSVKANTVYAPVPVLPGATNSNSAASAVADKSQGSTVKLPNAEGRTAVGEGARHRIEFEKK